MRILILHGIGGHAGIHWQQWLKLELENRGHTVLMPELPQPDHPDRSTWLRVVKEAAAGIPPDDLTIVGHSLGATTALDFIEQLDQPLHGFISVSGFANDYGAELNSYFLKAKRMDFNRTRNNVRRIAVLYGDNDPYVPQTALQEVAEGLGVTAHIIKNGGHLNSETGFMEFPALLPIIDMEMLAG